MIGRRRRKRGRRTRTPVPAAAGTLDFVSDGFGASRKLQDHGGDRRLHTIMSMPRGEHQLVGLRAARKLSAPFGATTTTWPGRTRLWRTSLRSQCTERFALTTDPLAGE